MPLLSWCGQHKYSTYPVSTQCPHSPHVTLHVHPNLLKQTIHYNRLTSEYRPVILISSWRFHVQFTSPTTTWGWPAVWHLPIAHKLDFTPIHLSAAFMASFVNISSFSAAMYQKSLCQRSDNCPKYYYYYLSCQCAAAQSLNVIHGIVCPRPVPGSCLLHPSLILVTVFNGTPSVMKKWWMFSENYWSDRHNWPFRRDNQIESLVPLTAGAHNSCFSWAIR